MIAVIAVKELKKNTTPRKTKSAAVPTVALKNPHAKHFPVVGFGASAGGLEAFTSILKYLQPNLGMAYVLVMHLSPKHKSALAEILQTKTKMRVHTVKDGMEVKPNNIYVIPPNAFMSLVGGHLKLGPRSLTAIGNFAIDYFLTALASVYQNNSIGVILSGTATDGTLGLKAIKAEGGITFAQDATAKFSSMPKNAYESGYADFILSPENIAKELAQLAKIPYPAIPPDKVQEKQQKDLTHDSQVLKKILLQVKAKTGIDFFLHYKQASIYRRVIRRVVLNKCKTLDDYFLLLSSKETEVQDLYNDFLINVTDFFRDADFYKMLDNEVFPAITKERKETDPIRIWVAGCATGEEAYSIAIKLTEFLNKKSLSIPFQIFATDLDEQAIAKARLGIYPLSALQNIPPAQFKQYFKKANGHYQIGRNIREYCVFSQHNLLKDPPFSRMDLISCQNVLIYLETPPQQRILQTFHYALKPQGFLFLGKSESIGAAGDLFDSLTKKARVYRRKSKNSPPLEYTTYKVGSAHERSGPHADRPAASDVEKDMGKILLKRFVAPSVVLNQNLNIVQFFGITGPYLEPVVGKASLNILKMIREDLLIDLRTLIQRAKKTEKIAVKEGIKIFNNHIKQELTLEVIPTKTNNELYFLVVFEENQIQFPQKKGKGKKSDNGNNQKDRTIINLEEELVQSREIIRTTNEEFESTYEELQANNEEILSSNEELQSVNEELETSKEELQSANEELTTINEELQKRNVELKESENYAKAIVDTVHNPFLVLTSNLQVRSANASFYSTFKLTPDKTEGRFVYELGDYTWDIPALREYLNELLKRKSSHMEFELKHFFSGIGEMVFTINAYRFLKEGELLILLAFTNVGELLRTNRELQRANDHLEQFAFIASHDLQEPLRKISIFSDLLLKYDKLDSYTKVYINKINVTSARMGTLLNDLMSYSILLKKREKLFVPVDLNTTVQNVLKDLELIIEEKGASLDIKSLPVVEGAPIQMHQLFFNIIHNALKFSTGKPIINITSENASPADCEYHHLKPNKDYVRIRISDNGIGFDQEYVGKMFSIFQKLHYRPGAEGSGMGLPFCKKIIEDHDGAIDAEGKENEGATFSIFLPRI